MRSRIRKAVAITLGGLVAVLGIALLAAMVAYSPRYVLRVLVWQDSDAFDWQKFPSRALAPAPIPYHFSERHDPGVARLFADLASVDDWEMLLDDTQTQAFIVVHNGDLVYERYFNDTERDSIVTSFSVAKSFTSALVGIAIAEGYIGSVDDPVTDYLPELADRDPRFEAITIRHLLMMASGLQYQPLRWFLFNGDDPLTTYYPDQRRITLNNTFIIDPPGEYFQYNKYHPQFLGMILERTTGMTVTEYLQTRIWDPLGMEFGGSWSLDSRESGFEKMETGVNARAIDFVKFGQLFLERGQWRGLQVIPGDWVVDSTGAEERRRPEGYYPDWFAAWPGDAYYRYFWWGMAREDDTYDFMAYGDKGQFIYISPRNALVIVRNGINYGVPSSEWVTLFYRFATQY